MLSQGLLNKKFIKLLIILLIFVNNVIYKFVPITVLFDFQFNYVNMCLQNPSNYNMRLGWNINIILIHT